MASRKKDTSLNYTIENIDSSLLEVLREDYQKPLNEKRVAQIVAEFDENIANEPKVSYRDGHYFVFDGQHTLAARIMRNGGRHLHLRCKVYRNLTPEQEALLFAAQTGRAVKPTPGNRLRARLYAKEEAAVNFRDDTEKAGFLLDVDGMRSGYHINCINTLWNLYRKLTPEQYAEALGVLREAWRGDKDSLLGDIISAICEFVRVYDGEYNRSILVEALKCASPRTIWMKIKSDFEHPGYRKSVYAIYDAYNNYCGPNKLRMIF